MKTREWIGIAVILLLLGTVYMQWKSAKNQETYRLAENILFQAAIQDSRAMVKSWQDSVNELSVRLALDRDSVKVVVSGLKMRNSTLSKKIAELRQEIKPQVDTLPEIKHFIALQDSSLSQKDSVISVLGTQNVTQYNSMSEIIRLQDKQIAEERDISTMLEGQMDNYQALYLKADKKAKKRWSLQVGAGYGVNKDGLSPQVGVQIGFDLLKF